ncbi:Phosphoribosylformylglycinamidine cyclo-ligase, chloroplastic [Vitis vinifera]|uniref:phosphoribosylformylglycinamidine cyclo-ligase n=1 Tax=Vitis vinifera TaxID=29760 RepID=A0A438IY34_VITVI|nr:Phosphoribosylformylglycinamidine cyclo-ligase, chloroplastic [Vitis vinifera]
MTSSLRANTELSQCFASSVRPYDQKAYVTQQYPCKGTKNCFSKRFSLLRMAAGKVAARRTRNTSLISSMSKNNYGESADMADSLTYKDAGVDIDAGSELVKRIAKMAPGIVALEVFSLLSVSNQSCDSYLVAGTDGVGTKLKLAFETGIHETIGIDLVAMSVNDIVTSGAKPLFFLDYFATSHLDVDLAEKVIKGIVDGCQQSDCVLLGGETAEMPDFYADGEYDLSGFAVGVGSVQKWPFSEGPTSCKGGVKGIAHITGGGFTDNIPRVFPKGLGAVIYKDSWEVPSVFKWIQEAGQIEDAEMRRTFNMGIGMVLVVSPEASLRILGDGNGAYTAYKIGEVAVGEGVRYG